MVLAHGADEAQFPLESRHSEIPGRPGRGFPGQWFQGPQDRQPSADFRHRQEVALPPGLGGRGHQFNEPHLQGIFPGEPGDIQDFVVIDASQHDAVDFQGMETQGNGLLGGPP